MTSTHILNLYELYVLPNLSTVKNDKKKLACIGSAIAATLLYSLYRKISLPPAGIRAIPRVNIFTYMASVLRGDDAHYQLKHMYAPLIAKANGVYVRPNRCGWSVYVADPADIRYVYSKAEIFPKAPNSIGEPNTLLSAMIRSPSIVTTIGESWKVHKKAAHPAFYRAMPVNLFGSLVQQVFGEIEKENGTINISGYVERFSFDAITAAGFGYNANAIGDKNSEWVGYYTALSKGAFDPFFFLFPIFDTTLRWMFPSRMHLHKILEVFLGKITQIIVDKREMIAKGGASSLGENEKDLCTLMIEAEEGEGGVLTNAEMMNDLLTFVFAGHDTTANAMASAMYYLATHKDIQQKLREEVIEFLGDAPEDVIPTVEQTKTMTYLNMVIKETLRIMGPAVWGHPRIAAEDTELGGFSIPKGTIIITDVIGVQHDERIWEEPYKFDPERFNPDIEDPTKRTTNAWFPFGSGQRQCIGLNMTMTEQRVVLAMMVRKYEFCLPKDSIHKDGMIIAGMDLIGPKELVLDFTKRY
ncbi:cytochrome P450 [Mucor mucedo]|uniref:cytochrome P450 n=1 Tax=Mucor mucedo TaxID=29922 RepID=UPI00221F5E83|nr:cytochrome P450 [Mucor mucedo]KAI7891077.1 cytochrome P450 [Mucor mucedo]